MSFVDQDFCKKKKIVQCTMCYVKAKSDQFLKPDVDTHTTSNSRPLIETQHL